MVALGGMEAWEGVSPTGARHIRRKRSLPIPIEPFSPVPSLCSPCALSANPRLSGQVVLESRQGGWRRPGLVVLLRLLDCTCQADSAEMYEG